MLQDGAEIKTLVERYRGLSSDALAALDDERHQLSAAEVTALDMVKASKEKGEDIAQSIRKLDAGKQRRFRIGFITMVLAVIIALAFFRVILTDTDDFAIAQSLALFVAAVAAEMIYRFWERWRDRHRPHGRLP